MLVKERAGEGIKAERKNGRQHPSAQSQDFLYKAAPERKDPGGDQDKREKEIEDIKVNIVHDRGSQTKGMGSLRLAQNQRLVTPEHTFTGLNPIKFVHIRVEGCVHIIGIFGKLSRQIGRGGGFWICRAR